MPARLVRFLAALLATVLAAFLPATSIAASEEPVINADGAVLMEANTRKVLYCVSAHESFPMASTTKVMTAILAIELCPLDEYVEITAEAYGTEGSSMYLELGERIRLRDLLYGLMLISGNDAAVAIATHVAGSVESFAELMNAKAKELGALNTHFVNPNGLHDEAHYTTAYDLALITAYAMANGSFREIVSTEYYRAESGSVPRTLKNKNRILWEYEGGNGVKTGYTMAAGKCLVFAAEREGMQLVGVLLNCYDLFPCAKAMLDYGFSAYCMQAVISAGQTVARVRLEGAEKSMLALTVKGDIMMPVKRDESVELRTSVSLEQPAIAPISKGDRLGTLEIYSDSRLLCTEPLVASESVEATSYGQTLLRLFSRWAS